MSNIVLTTALVISCLVPGDSYLTIHVPQIVYVFENAPNGSVLFSINATNDESVTFEADGTETKTLIGFGNVEHFNNVYCANVTLNSTLDRDYDRRQRKLEFVARDSSNTVPAAVLLIIKDVNDERPIFDRPGYRVLIKESERNNSVVVRVTTTDPDTGNGGQVRFGLTTPDEYKFVIDKITGEIHLNGTLDYETAPYYQYNVTAWDLSTNGTPEHFAVPVDFSVAVQDVQDTPPYFRNLPYFPTISESASIGSSVITVQASDGDQGVPNKIKYTLEVDGMHQNNFTINETSGMITVARKLDIDTQEMKQTRGVIIFHVIANEVSNDPSQVQLEKTNASARVTITVTDINDNIPTFTHDVINASVPENTNAGVQVKMDSTTIVQDIDLNAENNLFNLTVQHNGLAYDGFETVQGNFSQTTVTLRVNNSTILDYEQRHNVTFQIVARETSFLNGNSSTATVVVRIEDINDNRPVFDTREYTFNISENATIGSFVGRVNASDVDTGSFGTVFYMLEDQNTDFNISKKDGKLNVATVLNREKTSFYSLRVLACDNEANGNDQQTGTARINIHIADINNNCPVFEGSAGSHRVAIPLAENIANGTIVTTVQATDKDQGVNAQVEYFIMDDGNATGRFTINKTMGVVTVTASLIGYSGTRFITIEARDKGQPPLSGYRNLIFSINDVNLNSPNFTCPAGGYNITHPYILTISEEKPHNSTLMTLAANDSDAGDNGKVAYRIEPSAGQDWTYFQVDAHSGRLSNTKRLDREKHPEFRIQVTAQDSGHPMLKTTLSITVRLNDIDDNDPKFPNIHRPYKVKVMEGLDLAKTCLANVNISTDADEAGNTKRCYYIHNGEQPYTNYFTLNATTGDLCLNKELDREKKSSINMTVRVSRNCSSTGTARLPFEEPNGTDSTLLWVKVVVLDKNDNSPVFSDNGQLSTGILYDVDIGEIVYDLRNDVQDADELRNAVTYFRDLGQTSKDIGASKKPPFVISTNGTVATNRLFSSSMLGHVDIAIEAYDIGNRTAKGLLRIYIISNIQRVKIIFNLEPDEVRQLKSAFIRELEQLLNYVIVVDKIVSHQLPDHSSVLHMTDMFIHALYNDTGELVPADKLWSSFDFTKGVSEIFVKYGVTETQPVTEKTKEDTLNRTLTLVLVLVAACLTIISVSLAISLYCIRGKYIRRLRAELTSSGPDEITKKVPVAPGTNVHRALNPLYMLEKDIPTENEDNDSNDSLDINAVNEDEVARVDEQEVVMTIDSNPDQSVSNNMYLDVLLCQHAELAQTKGDKKTLDDATDGDSGNFHSMLELEQSDI